MKMKRFFVLLCMVFICTIFFVEKTTGQYDDNHDAIIQKQIETVKEEYDFDNWGAEEGKVISGVAISEEIFPLLSQMKKVWPEDNYNVNNIQQSTFIEIRKWWRSGNDEFEVKMVVGPTFEAAKEYLILSYTCTQRESPLIKPPGHAFGLNIGDVCFVTAKKQGQAFSSIDFIRHNVIFIMRAEGSIQSELGTMAKTLDRLLQKQDPVGTYTELPELPAITTFSSRKTNITLGDEVILRVKVHNPQDRQLHYFWDMTGGGIEKDLSGNFVYYGSEDGNQIIAMTVVNDMGLYNTRTLNIKVMPKCGLL